MIHGIVAAYEKALVPKAELWAVYPQSVHSGPMKRVSSLSSAELVLLCPWHSRSSSYLYFNMLD